MVNMADDFFYYYYNTGYRMEIVSFFHLGPLDCLA